MGDITNDMKKMAAIKAVDDYVISGMVLGLGTGSTTYYAIKYLSDKINSGKLKNIVCVATSESTYNLALKLALNIVDIDSVDTIDLAIDGADEIDVNLNLIKGGGGALLREKIVETKSNKFVVIADESKLNKIGLGCKFPIPVEIVPFGYNTVSKNIALVTGCDELKLRKKSNDIYVTNNGNYIVDILFKSPPPDVNILSSQLSNIVGVVAHGLFIDMASECIICDSNLKVYKMDKKNSFNYF